MGPACMPCTEHARRRRGRPRASRRTSSKSGSRGAQAFADAPPDVQFGRFSALYAPGGAAGAPPREALVRVDMGAGRGAHARSLPVFLALGATDLARRGPRARTRARVLPCMRARSWRARLSRHRAWPAAGLQSRYGARRAWPGSPSARVWRLASPGTGGRSEASSWVGRAAAAVYPDPACRAGRPRSLADAVRARARAGCATCRAATRRA